MPESQSLVAGRYRLLQPLGSGGFGDTFLARDEQLPSGRQVVVKRLRPIQDDEQTRQTVETAFLREASVLEDLGRGNPQIPELFAYFQEAGAFWLVQEYIPGPTLQSLGRIDSRQAIRLLGELLPVLEHLHSRGILHRDIKPDNIILREGNARPVLIDFGAVRESMAAVQLPSGSIRSTVVIGTQGFMAPEQAAGRPIFSSDLYALALTVIAMLTGQSPQELPADPVTGVLQWHAAAGEIDPALVTLLNRAIQAIPALRYPSAQEMKAAVLQLDTPSPATVIVAPAVPPQPVSQSPAPDYGTVLVAPLAPAVPPAVPPADTVMVAPSRSDEPLPPSGAQTTEIPSARSERLQTSGIKPGNPDRMQIVATQTPTYVASNARQVTAYTSRSPRVLVGLGAAVVATAGLAMVVGLRCRLLNSCPGIVASRSTDAAPQTPGAPALASRINTLQRASSIDQLRAAIRALEREETRLAPSAQATVRALLQKARERLTLETQTQSLLQQATRTLESVSQADSSASRQTLDQVRQQLSAIPATRFDYPRARQLLQEVSQLESHRPSAVVSSSRPSSVPTSPDASIPATELAPPPAARPQQEAPLWGGTDREPRPSSSPEPLW